MNEAQKLALEASIYVALSQARKVSKAVVDAWPRLKPGETTTLYDDEGMPIARIQKIR